MTQPSNDYDEEGDACPFCRVEQPCPDHRVNNDGTADLLNAAWGVIANAGNGDWDWEASDWREAAERWRDRYHAWLKEHGHVG